MAYGSNPVMLNSYLQRGNYYRDNPKSNIVIQSNNMESYLYNYIVELEEFDVQYTGNRVIRVRADGKFVHMYMLMYCVIGSVLVVCSLWVVCRMWVVLVL